MEKSICQTCLSKDRCLIPQCTLMNLLQEINIWEVKAPSGGVCWECHCLLLKFTKFKAQVRQAQETLVCKIPFAKPLSRLCNTTKTYFDYEFHESDPLTKTVKKTERDIVKTEKALTSELSDGDSNEKCTKNVTLDIKTEFDEVNYTDGNDESTNLTDDEKPMLQDNKNVDETIYTESLDRKVKCKVKKDLKRVCKRKPVKKLKATQVSDEDEMKEKIEKIVYSEREMLKIREEKRNHPNFKKIPFKCDSCVLGFTRQETFDVHLEKKHNEAIGDYICNVCFIRFPSEEASQRHRSKHFTCYRCRLCKYETVEQWSALNHCRAKHSADTRDSIHCAQCSFVARTPEDLAEHIKTQHSLHCHECGEKFKGKHTLRTHIARIHSVKREFTCDICSRTFSRKSRLESHMARHEPSLARRLAYCDQCRVQYKSVQVYRGHVRNSASHAVRAYPCTECNKQFVSKVYWTKHYNFYHLKKSDFKCELCNKLFISDCRLKNHKQIHHGLSRPRDHPCNICGKKFYTQSTLRGHQLTHSSERTYMCEDCGDTFKQRPALYTHVRLVHASRR